MAAITVEAVKEMASKQRQDACHQLGAELGCGAAFKDDDLQKQMIIDYLYDTLMYCIKKGFPWEHVCHIYTLAHAMISVTKDRTLPEAIKVYKGECDNLQDKVSSTNLKILTDYFFDTFFSHFKLYQYVFNKDQEKLSVNVNLDVETMPELEPFSEAKDISIWNYEKKLEDMEMNYQKQKEEREKEEFNIKNQHEKMVSDALDQTSQNEVTSDKEKLLGLIQSVAAAHITAVTDKLTFSVKETMEELEHHLEKTAVPRPSELGPPPRMKTKAPLSPAAKRQKSATRGKSAKSRAGTARKGKGK